MAPKLNKGKGVASSSHGNKRSRETQNAPNEDASMPPQPPRFYGLRRVMGQEGKKWFKEHNESKYSHELFVDRISLAFEFPHIIDRLHTLGLNFVFNDPNECNLNMVREFLANWDLKERVGTRFEDTFDDDDAIDDEQATDDSDLESDDDRDYSEMGEASFAPTYNED
ncbi:hypothetical protein HAX54_001227 [Datura stramonium]|uniref:Uncharacterized protein n=1 Tax=Datura stramonium TaxID=4076 RepID=A0ABS8WUI2_DATST|nr:hypothetical protein [Datura stramonium]